MPNRIFKILSADMQFMHRLTFHLQGKHKLQITSAMLHDVVHVTRALAISPQIIICAHSGGLFFWKITTSLYRIQLFRSVSIVYSIAPHVNVAKAPRHHYYV